MKRLRRIKSIYIYRAVIITAQLLFYREMARSLSFADLGMFAQTLSLCLIGASAARFGCHTSLANMLMQTGTPEEEHKRFALAYTFRCCTSTLLPLLGGFALLLVGGQVDAFLVLIFLYAINVSFSFVERALANFRLMSVMDPGSAYIVLTGLHLLGLWEMHSFKEVLIAIALVEAVKTLVYLVVSFKSLNLSKIEWRFVSPKVRVYYFANDFLSILTTNGMHVYFPFLIGADISGKFFILQRLAFPLQFLLNVKNAIWVSKFIKGGADKKAYLYRSGLVDLWKEGALGCALLLAAQIPILEYFDMSGQGHAYTLILAGYFLNLSTGPSAPLFNAFGIPRMNLYSNLFGFVSLVVAAWGITMSFGSSLLAVCVAFALASLWRNLLVYLFVRRVLQC